MVIPILFLTYCLLFLGASSGNAVEMGIQPGVRGVWKQSGESLSPVLPWKAQWIWMDEDIASDMMLARRSFDLTDKPEEARLRITATSQYQLFVNGTFVCHGPARCAPHHQSFDKLDIASLLRKGGNTVAVRVHYLKGVVSYHHLGRAGFLSQLDLVSGGKTDTFITDSSWKVHPDPVWDNVAPRINRFHSEVGDRVDLRLQLRNWSGPDFDDASWPAARPLQRNTGWPQPQDNARPLALIPPWTSLVLRDLPYLVETETKALDLIEASTVAGDVPAAGRLTGEDNTASTLDVVTLSNDIDERIAQEIREYKEGDGPLVIPGLDNGRTSFLLFDFGKVLNARPHLDIEGPAGTVVEVMCAP
ncbi:MAG TPA: alpha-L-rhamnosidase N-terminal domain-containing protein, partial [Acidobacteriota bacterium]|nr:alpha-L-rhamnosidase N-terminal domain-containing protein [Acidobacteriota bacterium]